jgi:hypothetical protein
MKKSILFVCALLCLMGVAMAQTHDTTAPVVTAFTFTPSNPNAQAGPATVTFTVTATDDLSGVAFIQVVATGPAGVSQVVAWAGSGGTSTTQTLALVLPEYSASGTWTVSYVTVKDSAGNTKVYQAPDLTTAGFATTFTAQ